MTGIPFIVQIPVGASVGGAFDSDIIQMIIHAGPVVKFVLAILLFFSTVSWAIIFVKFRLFRNAKQETERVLEIFWEGRGLKTVHAACKDLPFSPVARLFRAGYSELSRIQKIQASVNSEEDQCGPGAENLHRSQQTKMDNLDRSLKRAEIDQVNKMEKALGFLATTGNTAPFIGLFGTVWGIMDAFRGIGLKGAANLAVVAPGISEALIATAAGLAAAIPAVVAFNFFNQRISALRAEMDIFKSDFLSMVERQLFKEDASTKKQK
jgi:biopolymer transport protein TolQ